MHVIGYDVELILEFVDPSPSSWFGFGAFVTKLEFAEVLALGLQRFRLGSYGENGQSGKGSRTVDCIDDGVGDLHG